MQRAIATEKLTLQTQRTRLLKLLANQNHGQQRQYMDSQTLTPFMTKHLWHRRFEGCASYTICATIADEPVTWQTTAKHTLHPGSSTTKRMTTRWVQGVWGIRRIRDGKEYLY
jgi:hypothetical protein